MAGALVDEAAAARPSTHALFHARGDGGEVGTRERGRWVSALACGLSRHQRHDGEIVERAAGRVGLNDRDERIHRRRREDEAPDIRD
jgi:hypothetical protein